MAEIISTEESPASAAPAAVESVGNEGAEPTEGLNEGERAADEVVEGTEGADTTTTEDSAEGEESSDKEEGADDFDYKYSDTSVEIDIPDDLRSELAAKDLDVDELAKELYSGEFSLSDETRAKLDEAYGKFVVDSFLSSLKVQNDLNIQSHKDITAKQEAADKVAWDAAMEQVGGEDGWAAMESWAVQNLDDSAFDGFNKAMESGDPYLQKLAIQDMQGKYRESEGDTSVRLLEGETSAPKIEGALSASDYAALFKSGEYSKDPNKYDAMRRQGQKRGI